MLGEEQKKLVDAQVLSLYLLYWSLYLLYWFRLRYSVYLLAGLEEACRRSGTLTLLALLVQKYKYCRRTRCSGAYVLRVLLRIFFYFLTFSPLLVPLLPPILCSQAPISSESSS